ncbi:MAG: aspartate dehydrogenase [Proteobacteria bacterium]|nr:aspartate dehydrogenase [Pseudomonadota bacterium]MDA1022184.1 aspartate dehydrogenase [Pseudomonadota bacterium]
MTIGTPKKPLRVGIAGLGTVGLPVAKWLDGGVEGLELSAVAAGNQERAEERLQDFNVAVPVLGIKELVAVSDIIVESAPPEMFVEIAETTLKAGLLFVPLSVTSLLDRMDLVDLARETGARIIVPTGAILGLDAIRSAALGVVHSVTMLTRKPPAGLKKAPFVIEQGIDLDGLEQPLMLFRGNAAEAAKKFPANVNVAVALGLAGVGPEKTDFEIWADPGVTRNTHTIKVVADTANFEMTIAVQPTPDNPATGMIVPLSVMETLRGLVTPFKVGT